MARRKKNRRGQGAAAVNLTGSTVIGPLEADRLGITSHELIYEGCRRGLAAIEGPDRLERLGRALLDLWAQSCDSASPSPRGGSSSANSLSAGQGSTSDRHRRRPTRRLVGTEIAQAGDGADGESRFSIVWETAQGSIVIDELKCGRLTLPTLATLDAQLDRYCKAAAAKYADAFAGIRACMLMAPASSHLVLPDGRRSPLEIGGSDA